MTREKIAAVVKHLRKASAVKQAEIAEGLGISQSQWCRYENGDTPIPLETLIGFLEIVESDLGVFHKKLLTVQLPTKTSFKPWKEVKKQALTKRGIR